MSQPSEKELQKLAKKELKKKIKAITSEQKFVLENWMKNWCQTTLNKDIFKEVKEIKLTEKDIESLKNSTKLDEEIVLGYVSQNSSKKLKNLKKEQKQKQREYERLQTLKKEKEAGEITFKQAIEGEKVFGQLPLLTSQNILEEFVKKNGIEMGLGGTKYIEVRDITKTQHLNKKFSIRCRCHSVTGKGGSCFIIGRQGVDFFQAVLFVSDSVPKQMVKWAQKFLPKESIIEISGVIQEPTSPITRDIITKNQIEVSIEKLFLISEASSPLPLLVEDCMAIDNEKEDEEQKKIGENKEKKEKGEEEEKTKNKTGQEKRLDNRVIDMRAPGQLSIFKICSACCQYFREYLLKHKFTEIHTPKFIGAASEGGSEVFQVKYFDRFAYLAQSPQLYKQMCVVGDLMRVFEIGPVFRAEKSFTKRHLTEFIGLDIEMAFKNHYHEVVNFLHEVFIYIFDKIEENFPNEIKSIRKQFPHCKPLQYKGKKVILHYKDAVKMIRERGGKMGDYDDLSKENEDLLGKIVKEKYQTDFFILDKFPMEVRPFYTMPDSTDPKYSNSYDIFIRGEEVSSGAQRIHDSKTLLKLAKEKEVDMTPLKDYVDAFKYGAYPHAGCGIGLERIAKLFLGIKNIRRTSMFPRDPVRLTP